MKIGLIDVDGHSGFPNLALMRLSGYHKARGDSVDWWNGFELYERVYMSKVFTFSPDVDTVIDADEIIQGGTGYKNYGSLPLEVEATYPDYSIYPNFKSAIGFLTRGCIRNCPWCIVPQKICVTLDSWGIRPFAQPYRDYDGGEPTEEQKHFARWVNCKQLFNSCSWAEYDRRR